MPTRTSWIAAVILALAVFTAACGPSPAAPTSTAVSVVSTSQSTATYAVTGTVRQGIDGQPLGAVIAGATVAAVGKSGAAASTTTTKADGTYRLEGLMGTFALQVTKSGFTATSVPVSNLTAERQIDILVPPRKVRLTGRVTEAPPTQDSPVAGATLRITAGPGAGTTVTSGPSGAFEFTGLWGTVTVEVTHKDYLARTFTASLVEDDLPVDVKVLPPAGTRSGGFEFADPYVYGTNVYSALLPVHHDGEIVVTDVWFYGFEQGDRLDIEVWVDGRRIAYADPERSFPRRTVALRVPVTGGRYYTIRAHNFWPLMYVFKYTYPT